MHSTLYLALTLACAAAQSAPSSAPTEPARPWTLLVYGAADNNADGPILEFLGGVRAALDDDPGMELLLYLDRSAEFSSDSAALGADFAGARLYRLRSDSAERLDGAEFFPELAGQDDPEIDSADPRNIAHFIAFAKARFPARHYGLMIYSHANGEDMCPDEESGRSMGIAELSAVVPPECSVDFLALELCNMAGLEIAYQWRPGNGGFGADVLVAIPNAGPPLDWNLAFERVRSPGHAARPGAQTIDPAALTPERFATLVIEEGERGRRLAAQRNPERAAHEAAAALDLRAAAEAKQAVDALARALALDDQRETLLELRGPGPIGEALNYSGGGPFVDLHDLCTRIAACDVFGEPVRAAAAEATTAVDRLVLGSFGMPGYSGFQPGSSGLFIVLPRPDKGARSNWSMFRWYTPHAGPPDGYYGRWAFLADGASEGDGVVDNWFELLDRWYDDETQGPGGFNGYSI